MVIYTVGTQRQRIQLHENKAVYGITSISNRGLNSRFLPLGSSSMPHSLVSPSIKGDTCHVTFRSLNDLPWAVFFTDHLVEVISMFYLNIYS